MEVEIVTVDLLPSGLHLSVCAEEVPASVDFLSLVDNTFSGIRCKVIPTAVHLLPSGHHHSVASEVIIILADVQPALVHRAVGQKVIVVAIVIDKSISHYTICLEIIPGVVDLLPSGCHSSGCRIKIVIAV